MNESPRNLSHILAPIIVSLAIAGYFTGLQAPMADHREASEKLLIATPADEATSGTNYPPASAAEAILPATHYSEIGLAQRLQAETRKKQLSWSSRFDSQGVPTASLPEVKPSQESPEEVTWVITQADKSFALSLRSLNRAFNGAPPTVPHPMDQMSSESCMLCHGQGFSMKSLRASKMSHQFLSECSQCHVENNPRHMQAGLFAESTFVGLPAPHSGPRAFPGAPPQIPHSTWMRVDCLSCHGPTGAFGIRTTHPWRKDCQQCHASASVLETRLLDSTPDFLDPIKIALPQGQDPP